MKGDKMTIDNSTIKYFEQLENMNINTNDTASLYDEEQAGYIVFSERQFNDFKRMVK